MSPLSHFFLCLPPFTLQISINGGAASCCNLKEFKDINTLLFHHASYCFRFTFQLPDPNYEEKPHMSQAPSNIVARTPQKLWVSCDIFLFATLSHPFCLFRHRSTQEPVIARSQLTDSSSISRSVMADTRGRHSLSLHSLKMVR